MSKMGSVAALLAEPVGEKSVILDALRAMRTHLGMEIGYLSEFVDDDLVFRAIDAPGYEHLAEVGGKMSLTETYCRHILRGDLPNLIPDTQDIALSANMPITSAIPIRAHVSVPIERSDGTTYGMFCCLSPRPNKTLNDRDLELMRMFARLAQSDVQRTLEEEAKEQMLKDLIHSMIDEQRFDIVYQPIFDLETNDMAGVEALCRFKSDPYRPPNVWFDDAAWVGLGVELELAVFETALEAIEHLPDGAYLSLNASPQAIASGKLPIILAGVPPECIVIEVTEHVAVKDWASLDRALSTLRELGIKIAIDDAGAGYAGLQHMVRLRPEIIKLDRSLVSGIDQDRARRSLCAAMVHYAAETSAALVAEGIETEGEMQALRDLGVGRGQGFYLGRPASIAVTFGHGDTAKTTSPLKPAPQPAQCGPVPANLAATDTALSRAVSGS